MASEQYFSLKDSGLPQENVQKYFFESIIISVLDIYKNVADLFCGCFGFDTVIWHF